MEPVISHQQRANQQRAKKIDGAARDFKLAIASRREDITIIRPNAIKQYLGQSDTAGLPCRCDWRRAAAVILGHLAAFGPSTSCNIISRWRRLVRRAAQDTRSRLR
jgi:hypothetical protein